MTDENPYIQPENYYAGYQESIDRMKEKPDVVEFDKLCHMVFNAPDGKALMNEIDKRFIMPALASPANPNYDTLVVFMEGFKEAFRTIKNCITAHEQRIRAEVSSQ